MNHGEQTGTRCVLMRGGTSKAMFFHAADVPPPGPARDAFLKRAMGTPDVMQIDGLGGSRLVTSKVAIVARSTRADADVDYTFAQCDIERDDIGYDGNCGNISSAVGPFAIDEGLVAAIEPVTTVRIWNTNTEKHLVAKVQVRGGKARVSGDCAIPGVPGTGAEILMDYAGTVGAKTGRLLPTGQATDVLTLDDGRRVDVSVVDTANPCVFIRAADLGLSGSELPAVFAPGSALVETIGEIQARVGESIGLYRRADVHLPGLPLAVVVAAAADYVDLNGVVQPAAAMDLRARLVFLGKCHESMAGTGAMCTAAASRVPASVVHEAIGAGAAAASTLRIGHPLGSMEVKVIADRTADPAWPTFSALGLTRTARRLMAGMVYVPEEGG